MTVGGWPLADKAHIGDDHSMAYSSLFAGVPAAWNVIRAPKVALYPVQAVLLTSTDKASGDSELKTAGFTGDHQAALVSCGHSGTIREQTVCWT